jgi:hypothetical protein
MKTIMFTDPWLKDQRAFDRIQEYLGGCQAWGSVGRVGWMSRGEDKVGLMVEVEWAFAEQFSDIINDFLVEARYETVVASILRSLAWKFSSPALTSTFRDLIVTDVTGDYKLSPTDDLK